MGVTNLRYIMTMVWHTHRLLWYCLLPFRPSAHSWLLLPSHLPCTLTRSITHLLTGAWLSARAGVVLSERTWALTSGSSGRAGLDAHQINNDKCGECYKAVWDAADVTRTVCRSVGSIFLNCLSPYFQSALRAVLRGDRNFMSTVKSS